MAKANPEFKFSILTPHGILIDDLSVTMVICPGEDGDLGILAHHTPLITPLRQGEISLWKGHQKIVSIQMNRPPQGFLSVEHEHTIITLDAFCITCHDIKIEGQEHLKKISTAACPTCSGKKNWAA